MAMVCVKDWRFMLWYVLYYIQNKYALYTPTKKDVWFIRVLKGLMACKYNKGHLFWTFCKDNRFDNLSI